MTEQSSWQTRCLRTYYFKETLMRKAVVFLFKLRLQIKKGIFRATFLGFLKKNSN